MAPLHRSCIPLHRQLMSRGWKTDSVLLLSMSIEEVYRLSAAECHTFLVLTRSEEHTSELQSR